MTEKTPNLEFADKIIEQGGKTLTLCFQCGTCTGSCPSGRQTALRTRKLVRRAQLGLKEDIIPSDELWLCTTCFTCYERCPRGVEIVDIVMILRNMAVREGHMADAHKNMLKNFFATGHMIPFGDADKAKREKVGIAGVPPTVLSNKNSLDEMKKIIAKTGMEKIITGGK